MYVASKTKTQAHSHQFKKELIAHIEKEPALASIITETYKAWCNQQEILLLWLISQKPTLTHVHRADYQRAQNTLMLGNVSIWESFEVAGCTQLADYRFDLPETLALGDALGVAYVAKKPILTHS